MHNIPKQVFNKQTKKDPSKRICVNASPGASPVVSKDEETAFAQHISNIFDIDFELRPKNAQYLVIQLLPQLNDQNTAKNWYYKGFLNRFPVVGSRKINKLDGNRAVAYSKERFLEYFDLISRTYARTAELNEEEVTSDIAFNADETGHITPKLHRMLGFGRKSSK